MTTPILSATNVEEQDSTTMTSSSTTTRSWTEVASAIWEKRRVAPKYPKNLTVYEILHQAEKAFQDDTPEKVVGLDGNNTTVREVPRGTGLMMRLTQLDSDKIFPFERQFYHFVRRVTYELYLRRATPSEKWTLWPTWKHAWADFAEYAGLNTLAHKTARLKEGFPA